MRRKLLAVPAISGAVLLALAAPAYAQDIPEGVASQVILDNIWMMIAGVLVFFMQAGLKTIGLRVTPAEELAGLDVEEHGAAGYGPDLLAGVGMPRAAMTAHDHVPSSAG